MKEKILVCCVLFVFLGFLAAAENESKSPWDFSVTTDFAYYPKSAYVLGANHFAPLTGIYSGLEFRLTGSAGYTIPVPFGENPLVSANTLRFYGRFEISPVSVAPAFGVSFTPIAFLNFSAGTSIGTAWDIGSIQGLAAWNPHKYDDKLKKYGSYDSLPFKSARWDAWFQGAFMFDLAAVKSGDWNHVVAYAACKLMYRGITCGGENGNPWLYQGSGEKINGWQYGTNLVVAYQMPLVLQTIGLQSEFEGQLNGKKDFASQYHRMNPDFMKVSVSPIFVFKFTQKDNLTAQFQFSGRRSFIEKHTAAQEELGLTYAGREWYFNRIALSYKHSF